MRRSKALGKKVKEGIVPIENAAPLGRVAGRSKEDEAKKAENGPESQDSRGSKDAVFDDLLAQAETLPPEDFKETLDDRVEKGRTEGRKTEKVVLRLSRKGKRNLRRACDLESKKAKGKLTDAQALERILARPLDAKDPLRGTVGTRKRRMGKTPDDPTNRRVPAAVQRALAASHDVGPRGDRAPRLDEGGPSRVPEPPGRTFLPGASGVQRDKVPRGTIRRRHPAMKAARKRPNAPARSRRRR